MEAKDTVMQQIYPQTHEEHLKSLQNQAEISFKAGRKAEREFILQNTDRDKRARLEGIRELVEWMNQNHHYPQAKGGYYVPTILLEAKLKELEK